VIDESPDFLTLQEEQFADLVTLAQAGVVFPPDVYLDASNLRNKKQLKEKLQPTEDPQAAAMVQEAAAMQKRMAEAEVAKKEAEAAKTGQEAEQTAIENAAGKAALAGMASG
jgi:arginine/lysine/ornithine decarboxylase